MINFINKLSLAHILKNFVVNSIYIQRSCNRKIFTGIRMEGQKSATKGPYLYAFDFDQTITNEDSETVLSIPSLLGSSKVPDHIIDSYITTNNWAKYMDLLMKHLANRKVSMETIQKQLLTLEFLPGTEKLLQKIREGRLTNSRSKFIIISDGNDYFIKTVLSKLSPTVEPNEIIANKATISSWASTPETDKIGIQIASKISPDIPYLKVEPYETQTHCAICPPNLCKGAALENFKSANGPFEKVYYTGDGSNDLCAALKLGQNDVLFVRKGFGLERSILRGTVKNSSVPIKISSKIVYFDDASDILKNMEF